MKLNRYCLFPLAILACLSLALDAVASQTNSAPNVPNSSVGSNASPSPSHVPSDPIGQAKEILQQYEDAKSANRTDQFFERTAFNGKPRTLTEIKLDKPNGRMILATRWANAKTDSTALYDDGKFLYEYTALTHSYYRRSHRENTFFSTVGHPQLFASPRYRTYQFVNTTKVDNRACFTLRTIPNGAIPPVNYRLDFDQQTHLLIRATIWYSNTLVGTTDICNETIDADIPAAAFHFSAPPAAKLVEAPAIPSDRAE